MASPSPAPIDFSHVQGDILAGGIPKKTETYYFFQIDAARVGEFRTQLAQFIPLITTTAQVLSDRKKIEEKKKNVAGNQATAQIVKLSGINISFTQKGLTLMGIDDKVGDDAYDKGMLAGAQELHDPGTKSSSGPFSPDWKPAFKQDIHGLILVAGDSHLTVAQRLAEMKKIFLVDAPSATIHKVTEIVGDVRPGQEKGHEHFGFLDGVSQPAVQGVDSNPNAGQGVVPQGIILLGREGDAVQSRPPWALDGSFLSFRYLSQLVPEFNAFLKNTGIAGLPAEQGSELLGARLVGRWKSGAPIDITPLVDDPALGADPTRNNDFSYNQVSPDDQTTQDRCPFAAHTRKTFPRADLQSFGGSELHRIIRSGIPFGPEVSAEEAATGKTQHDRGLLFVAYQSNIANGFQFIQQRWANAPDFPPAKPVEPGFDPIIGQSTDPTLFRLSGTDPKSQADNLPLPTQWVVPRGGEYFFSPSIPALQKTFALAGSANGSSAEL